MAEGKNKLYITISDERGGGTPTPQPSGSVKKEKEEIGIIGRYFEHEMFHLVKQQVTQSVNFALSNIGNFTGDYITQTRVNEAKQFVDGFVTIGNATIAGASVAQGAGAIIGFIASTASLMTQGYYQDKLKRNEVSKMNYEIAQLRERAGLNSILDGSRGTEN